MADFSSSAQISSRRLFPHSPRIRSCGSSRGLRSGICVLEILMHLVFSTWYTLYHFLMKGVTIMLISRGESFCIDSVFLLSLLFSNPTSVHIGSSESVKTYGWLYCFTWSKISCCRAPTSQLRQSQTGLLPSYFLIGHSSSTIVNSLHSGIKSSIISFFLISGLSKG